MMRSLLLGRSSDSSESDTDDPIQEAVAETITESNQKTVEIRPANQRSGRRFPLMLLLGAAIAVGYWLRRSENSPEGLQDVANRTADRTKTASERAAQTIQERGGEMAKRVEEGSQRVGDRVQEKGEQAAEKTEEAGETVAQRVEEGSQKAGEQVQEKGEKAAEKTEEVGEKSEEIGEKASEKSEEAGEKASEKSEEIGEKASKMTEEVGGRASEKSEEEDDENESS